MKIIKGKYAGQEARLHQFANGWMMVDGLEGLGSPEIVKPDQVQLTTPEEMEMVRSAVHVGDLWKRWTLQEDGTFRKLPDLLEGKVTPPDVRLPRW